jgi:hypothetical protein
MLKNGLFGHPVALVLLLRDSKLHKFNMEVKFKTAQKSVS